MDGILDQMIGSMALSPRDYLRAKHWDEQWLCSFQCCGCLDRPYESRGAQSFSLSPNLESARLLVKLSISEHV
jgi:hypothetical protein